MALRVPGFLAAGVACGIKDGGALDLAVIASERPAVGAAVFTRNRVPGAPIRVSRPRARRGRVRAVVVNSGISNVATGERGCRDAREMTAAVGRELEIPAGEVLVSSTGVIGVPLPMRRILRGIPMAVRALSPAGWNRAARAILTTDLRPKLVHQNAAGFALLGIAKGSGMTMPNMATMLAYLVTDLAIERSWLSGVLREVVDSTFNRLSIDGETSTSDSVAVMANGAAGNRPIEAGSRRGPEFVRSLAAVCQELVEKIAADGEGVTRLADVVVSGARSNAHADRIARKIANSILVKTALFGSDPNYGRLVQAAGAAGVPIEVGRLGVRVGGVWLLRNGVPVGGTKALRRAERAMKQRRVELAIVVGSGAGRATLLTCDLSYEYVRINAEYTT
ncbi:MAG: bifunctional glutamate N-acetyltransferase/amino-acid acetyltransferase ArgJ [Myxococcales bacterium]|nr:bifunctional glutamate N-acetyltransferase/amino-acid acetyltransferase ArgJ [Myxococcales bacterium]